MTFHEILIGSGSGSQKFMAYENRSFKQDVLLVGAVQYSPPGRDEKHKQYRSLQYDLRIHSSPLKNGWLEYNRVSFWVSAYFQGGAVMLVLGRVGFLLEVSLCLEDVARGSSKVSSNS